MSRWSISGLIILILVISAGWVNRPLPADLRRVCPEDGGRRPDGTFFDPGREHRPSEYSVKIIDFTDQGELVDRCKLSDFLLEIKKPQIPVFVVIYVHGWKHDSDKGDDDLKQFTILISKIQAQFGKSRHVIGGFFSWPGRAGLTPVGENLSFWNRKAAADRVAISGNVAKLLAAVNSVRCQRGRSEDMVVGVGHSFGARILFSSVSYAILHDSQMKHPGFRGGTYGQISGAVDLTILLNPAFEASRYTSVDSLRRPLERFAQAQQPVLITISTNNDYATKFAFPTGQVVSGSWHERERSTVGNYPGYVTHVLSHSSDTRVAGNPDSPWWYDRFCHAGICLERTASEGERLNPGNPFIVARTDASIIDGHNDIWDDTFLEWIAAFVAKSTRLMRDPSCKAAPHYP